MPNVFEMYVANGNHAGFWVKRNSWGNTCARVKSVHGREAGELPGVPPYFNVSGEGKPRVIVDIFDLHTGALKDADVLLSCPGTYGYEQIEPPRWRDG
jgi:hypothetical protein